MKGFSPELLEAFNPNGGEGARYIEWSVRFEVVQEEIYGDLAASAIENPDISRIKQTIDRNTSLLDVLTFELGGFPLDGSKVVPPRPSELPTAQVGLFMSELSDENGFFSSPQIYTATTAYAYDLLAVTLDWGFSPAADFTVEWFNGNTLLYSDAVSGNVQRISLMNQAVANVNKVVVTITRGRPLSFARLAEFIPGAIVEYDSGNGDSLSIDEVTDPLSERATAGTLRMVADNVAEQFNIFVPDGIYQYFKERMPLYPVISGRSPDGVPQRVTMGKYYLQAPQLKGNMAKLQLDATNLIGTLQDTQYTKGVYKTATLARFAEDVAADAGISISYPPALSSITLSAYIQSMSHAQAFADIARAANMILRVSVDDVLEFHQLDTSVALTIGMDDYRTGDGISPSDDTIYNTVELEAQSFTLGESTQLAQIDATGSISGGSVFYVDNAIITTTSGVYYPKYSPATNISASLSGVKLTITGQPLTPAKNIVTVTSRRENEAPFIYTAKSGPLIQAVNARAVANYTLQRKAVKRRMVKINYRGYPYLETCDIVDFNSGGDNTQPFFLTGSHLKMGGGMSGVLEAREL